MKIQEVVAGPQSIEISRMSQDVELSTDVQTRLIEIGLLDPPADGLFGPLSHWALSRLLEMTGHPDTTVLDSQVAADVFNGRPDTLLPLRLGSDLAGRVVSAMQKRGDWIARHPQCVNVAYVEGMNPDGTANDNAPNVFNDLRLVFSIASGGSPSLLGMWEGTTEPSRFWTQNPMNPTGAARIAFGQYKAWCVGFHHLGLVGQHEALVQVRPVTVCRDLNKDFQRTNDRTDTGIFGINQHWGYDRPRDDLGRSCAGCLVGRTKQGHRDFMRIVKGDPRFRVAGSYTFIAAVLPVALV